MAEVGKFQNKKVHKHLHLWPLGPHRRRLAVRSGRSKGSKISQYGCSPFGALATEAQEKEEEEEEECVCYWFSCYWWKCTSGLESRIQLATSDVGTSVLWHHSVVFNGITVTVHTYTYTYTCTYTYTYTHTNYHHHDAVTSAGNSITPFLQGRLSGSFRLHATQ